jgi:hypothetical protein
MTHPPPRTRRTTDHHGACLGRFELAPGALAHDTAGDRFFSDAPLILMLRYGVCGAVSWVLSRCARQN